MDRKIVSRILLVLLITSILTSAFSMKTMDIAGAADVSADSNTTQKETSMFVVGITELGDAFDFVGLVSVVAASIKNNGNPLVLFSLDQQNGGQVDLLSQSFTQLSEHLKPNFTYVVGEPDFNPTLGNVIPLKNSDPFTLCLDMIGSFWNESKEVVISNFENFTEAIQAVPVASSIGAPLLFYLPNEVPEETLGMLDRLAATEVVIVGHPTPAILDQLDAYNRTILGNPIDVAAFMRSVSQEPDYTILVNVADQKSPDVLVPKVSVVSSALAAYRKATVYPIDSPPMIPKVTSFRESAPPPGISTTGSTWIGSFSVMSQTYSAAVYPSEFPDDPEMVNIDLDHNGNYNDTGEGPFYTGEEVTIGELNFTIDVRTNWWETPRTVSQLWLHYPSSQSTTNELSNFYERADITQHFLTLAGHWDVLPFDIIDVPGTGQLSLASTSILSQTDENPYLDLAVGRVTSVTFAGASLSILKTVLCEQVFSNASWKGNVLLIRGDAGITDPQVNTLSAMFENSPYFNLTLYLQNNVTETTFYSFSTDKSLVYVGGHGWTGGIPASGLSYDRIPNFGKTSPMVFLDGCDTGGIDLPEDQSQSVALQLIEHGALGVIAPTRHSSDFPYIFVTVCNAIQNPIGTGLKNSRNFGVHWMSSDFSQSGRPLQETPSSYRNFVIHELIGDPAAALLSIAVKTDVATIMKGEYPSSHGDIFDDVLSIGYVPDIYYEWNIDELWGSLDKYKVVLREMMIDGSVIVKDSISRNLERIYDWISRGGSWMTNTFITGKLAIASLNVEDSNGPTATIAEPSHPIFNTPNQINSSYFTYWDPWVADSIIRSGSDLSYYVVLAKSGNYPVLLERRIDRGRIVVSGLAAGRCNKVEFIENLVAYLSNTTVTIPESLPADLNMDGTVNILDITIVAAAYNTKPGDSKWNVAADLDQNEWINILDISAVAKDYGKTV